MTDKMVRTNSNGWNYDTKSGAVLNTDNNEYERFKAERARINNEEIIRQRIEDLEQKFRDLTQIVEKLNG